MSHQVVFPDDDRWSGPKRLADRNTVHVTAPPGSIEGVGTCDPPSSGRKLLVLYADDTDFNYSSITLSFNGVGAKLYGTQSGAPDAFFGVDVPPPPSSSITSSSTTLPSTYPGSIPKPPEETVAPLNCDSVLWEAHGLADTRHTLRVSLQAQGGVYIYNATIEPPRTLSRTRLAEFIALPIGCIALLVAGAVVVWLRWKRRRRALAASMSLRPYGMVSHASTTVDSLRDRKIFLAEKMLPPIPPIELANDNGPEASIGLSKLERAVEQAGFSVSEIVTVLQRVHRAGEEEADADRPPGYDRAPDV